LDESKEIMIWWENWPSTQY